jgi:hypothetical protein
MTFLPTDTSFNLFEVPGVLIGVTIGLIVGITLVVLWIKESTGTTQGVLGIVSVVSSFIVLIVYLSTMGMGAAKTNETNLSLNLKQKYNIETFLSREDVRYKDHDRVEVTVDGVSHKLWLGEDKGSYEPVLFSGDGESNLDIKSIEKKR